MDPRAVWTAIIDAAFVLAGSILTMVLRPEMLPFALAILGALQPLVMVIVLHFVADAFLTRFVKYWSLGTTRDRL